MSDLLKLKLKKIMDKGKKSTVSDYSAPPAKPKKKKIITGSAKGGGNADSQSASFAGGVGDVSFKINASNNRGKKKVNSGEITKKIGKNLDVTASGYKGRMGNTVGGLGFRYKFDNKKG
jgi:hypothetical protein